MEAGRFLSESFKICSSTLKLHQKLLENLQLIPVRESLVLFPNMSSVAFRGAVSLASMVSTLPVEQERRIHDSFGSLCWEGVDGDGRSPVEAL